MFSKACFFYTFRKKYDIRVPENRFKIATAAPPPPPLGFHLKNPTKHQNRFSAPIKSLFLPSTARSLTNTRYVFFLHQKHCFHVNFFTY